MLLPKSPFAKTDHVGIAIEPNAIRAAKTDTSGKLQSQAEVTFQSPIIAGESVAIEAVSQGLKQVISKAGITNQFVPISLPEKFAFSKEHTFPQLNPDEITQAIKWQVEKIFPFPLNEIYYDWKQIEKTEQGIKALITVIPKKLLDDLKQSFHAAGLFPVSFESSTSALSRLLPKGSNDKLIILELNSFDASATLVNQGTATITTTTSFQQTNSGEQILSLLNQSIQSLIIHTNTNPQETAIYISGAKASQQLADVLTQSLGISTTLLPVESISPSFHIAFSMASSSIKPPRSTDTINLLPTSLKNYYHAISELAIAKAGLKYVIGFTAASVIIALASFISNQVMLDNLANERDLLQQAPPPQTDQGINLATLNQRTQRLIKLFPSKTSPEEITSLAISNVPNEIQITGFSYSAREQTIQIVGVAQDRNDLLTLKETLLNTGRFLNINLPLESITAAETSGFSMELKIDPQSESQEP